MVLKNHYIIPNKSSADIQTYAKKQVRNQQSINWLSNRSKRCLIGLQKGVGNALKGHLLQVNQASFRSQKGMCCLALHENSLQIPMIGE